MVVKKPSKGAEQLAAINTALKREIQQENALKEIEDKMETLKRQKAAIEREKAEYEATLKADPQMTAIAREMMADALKLQGAGTTDFAIYNPKYVSNEDKLTLLAKLLADYEAENKENRMVKGMPFTTIKTILANRYNITTDSAGIFFRNQLKEYETVGGSRNKKVLFKK
jgi:hypothetical protein